MSNILLTWLNEEVVLSKPITNIAQDFKNGYLFGELLDKFNQQGNFHQFINNDTPDAKIVNFCLLEPTMRQIGVFFNSKTAYEVMNSKPGTSKTLLYEIKTVLSSAIRMTKSLDRRTDVNKVIQIIKPSRPSYDATMSITFENAIRQMVENPNDLLMAKATKHFIDMNESYRESVKLSQTAQLNEMNFELQRAKQIAQQRRQHEREFAETWDAIGVEQWKKNQKIAKSRREMDKTINDTLASRKLATINQSATNARNATLSGIDEFEERLKNLNMQGGSSGESMDIAIKTAGGQPGTGVPEMTYIDTAGIQAEMLRTQKMMKEKNETIGIRQQEHDRRRKRFVKERETMHSTLLQSRADEEVVTQLLNTCEMEEVEKIAKMKTMLYQNVLTDNETNRKLLLEEYRQQHEENMRNYHKHQVKCEVDWVIKNRVKAQDYRFKQLNSAIKTATNQEILELAASEVNRILDVFEWTISLRNLSLSVTNPCNSLEAPVLPDIIWRDARNIYASSDIDIPVGLPLPVVNEIFDHTPNVLSWIPATYDLTWLTQNLLNGQDALPDNNSFNFGENLDSKASIHSWTTDLTGFESLISSFVGSQDKFEGQSQVVETKSASKKEVPAKKGKGEEEVKPSPYQVLPPQWTSQTKYDNVVGEIIIDSRCIEHPIPDIPQQPDDIPTFKVRLCLFGISDRLRIIFANALKEKYNLAIISVHEELKKATDIYDQIQAQKLSKDTLSDAEYGCIERIHTFLQDGLTIKTSLYVTLIKFALLKLDPSICPGFVISDFPSTKVQASALIHAFSNIDYDAHRPQEFDHKGRFVSTASRPELTYDGALCGIDTIFHLDSEASNVILKRLSVRNDYYHNEVVTLNKSMTNMQYLAEIVTPENCMDTLSLTISTSLTCQRDLIEYFNKLGVLTSLEVDEDVENPVENILEKLYESVDTIISSKEEILFINNDQSVTVETSENGVVKTPSRPASPGDALPRVESQSVKTPPPSQPQPASEKGNSRPPTTSGQGEGQGQTPPVDENLSKEGTLPARLATILNKIWNVAESHVDVSCQSFFKSMRDIRYTMLQRKGIVYQVIASHLLKRDSRQDIFDAFVENFNSFDEDFRYDIDLMADLHLKTLDLRDSLWDLTEEKIRAVNRELQTIAIDAICQLLIHRSYGEGIVLLQVYTELFVASLHQISDYFRSTAGFDYYVNYGQELEEINPIPDNLLLELSGNENGVGGKEKDKKKDAGKAANKKGGASSTVRDPVAPCLIASCNGELDVLPEAGSLEAEVVDDKSKKKAAAPDNKAKKGKGNDEGENIFMKFVSNAIGYCDSWSRGNFVLNRELYVNQEQVLVLVENAIWHEAERYREVITKISAVINAQETWLKEQEASLIGECSRLIVQRRDAEIACLERIVTIIQETIELNIPIKEQWQLSSDTLVIQQGRLVYPPPPEPIVPVENIFHDYTLNEEQKILLAEYLKQITLDEVLIEQDLIAFVHQFNSNLGGFGCTYERRSLDDNGSGSVQQEVKHFTFPKKWRHHQHAQGEGEVDDVSNPLNFVYQSVAIPGTHETTGIILKEEALAKFHQYGYYLQQLEKKNNWTRTTSL